MWSADNLELLFKPSSIAIAGKFDGNNDLSHLAVEHLKEWGYDGEVHILDAETPLSSITERPDLVMIDVSVEDTLDLMMLCGGLSVPYVMVFTYIPNRHEFNIFNSVVEDLKRSGTRVLGPHCQGIVNFADSVPLCWSNAIERVGGADGKIGFISQSGALGFSFLSLAARSGLKFRYMAHTGLASDLDLVDIANWMVDEGSIEFLIFYLEGIPDGRSFLELVKKAHSKGIKVAVSRGGVSSCVRRRASGRQGAKYFIDQDLWSTVSEQFGILIVDDFEKLIDLTKVFDSPKELRGNRAAILSLSSGLGIVQADRCVESGLKVPPLSKAIVRRLESLVLEGAYIDNPLDLTVEIMEDSDLFYDIVRIFIESNEIDVVYIDLPMMSKEKSSIFLNRLIELDNLSNKPIVCCWLMDSLEDFIFSFDGDKGNVMYFDSPGRAAASVGALYSLSRASSEVDLQCEPSDSPSLAVYSRVLNQYESANFVSKYGIKLVDQLFCRDMRDTLKAGEKLGYPVALKIVSSEIQSKQKARGVALNLKTEEELRNAYGRILERASSSCPGAVIDGVMVQRMITEGVECMIGVKRDPTFGPVIAVGIGGVLYDVIKDLSFRLAPVDYHMALEMVRSLRGFPLMSGARGAKTLNFKALAREIVKVSHLACAEPDLKLLDINPVFVTQKDVQIVDVYAYRKDCDI